MMRTRVAALLLLFLVAVCAGGSPAAPADETILAQIDEHVNRTPPEAAASIQSLADYLAKPAANEMHKVRAIYAWIVRNIDYDVAALASGNPGDQSAQTTLARRKAVCDGYSQLFEALARAAGLEAVEVIGYCRGAGYLAGAPLGPDPDHAWSAVRVDGNWFLLDSTWAAGYIDARAGFVRRSDDYYFLTPPANFVYDHLPKDPKWQLLGAPIAKQDFERLVYLRPGFFRSGLQVVSHPNVDITSDGNLTVTFGGPSDALLRARVGDAVQFKDDIAPTFVQREGSELKLNVSFASPGSYMLRLYAKRKGIEGPYEWAADYKVKVSEVKTLRVFYPETTATFHEADAKLIAPMTGRLKSGGKEAFKLSAPTAEAVSVIVGGEWIPLTKNGDVWEGEVIVKGEQVQVAARLPGSQSFYVLLTYSVG